MKKYIQYKDDSYVQTKFLHVFMQEEIDKSNIILYILHILQL